MDAKLTSRIRLVLLATMLWSADIFAQYDASMFWIDVHQRGLTKRMSFGNHIGSSYGIDSTMSALFDEYPGTAASLPPTWWYWIPGRIGQWGDTPWLDKNDFRGWTGETQVDTFSLLLCIGDYDCSGYSYRWQSQTELSARCDSMILYEHPPNGLLPGGRLNMFLQDSLSLDSIDVAYQQFLIVKYGAKLIDHCTDYYVATTGNDTTGNGLQQTPWRTITHALDVVNPSANDPVTIHVAAGTYFPTLTGETYPLKLKSYTSLQGEEDLTTILLPRSTPSISCRAIECDSVSNVTISGFTIRSGRAPIDQNVNYGGGIFVRNSSFITIRNNIMKRNRASNSTGGGAFGGAIAILESQYVLVTHNVIDSNFVVADGADGGGIWYHGNHGMISENTITNNSAFALFGAAGGGIALTAEQTILRNNVIAHNLDPVIGGGVFNNGSTLIIRNTIQNDTAAYYGGGIGIGSGSPIIGGSRGNGNNFASNGLQYIESDYGRQLIIYPFQTHINAEHNYFSVNPHDSGEVWGNIDVDPYYDSPVDFDTLDIVAVPSPLEFDTMDINSSKSIRATLFNVFNSLTDTLEIYSTRLNDNWTTLELASPYIPPFESESLTVTINPKLGGEYRDTLTILTNAGTLEIPIHATVRGAMPVQDASTIWIKAYGIPPAQAVSTFGNRIGNTFGLDTSFSYPPEYREQEPAGPPGFEVFWQKIRPSQPWGSFRGLLFRDYRDYSSSTQKDTFKLSFYHVDNSAATISFKWPGPSYLAAHCKSLYLMYTDSSGPVVINMFEQDTLTLPGAGDRGISYAWIYKSGIHLAETGVEDQQLPLSFSLSQNYPNPFNPETRIRYAVSSRQHISITIYDVLGRQVATLVNEVQEPGFRSVTWDSRAVPSGVYFCRLQAGALIEVKKMILLR